MKRLGDKKNMEGFSDWFSSTDRLAISFQFDHVEMEPVESKQ
ncbi:hypothetical protein [Listeria aquatica]|nr:hypothetical protein [Listeria aquatica]